MTSICRRVTDAVDKVGDEQHKGNNRIQVPSFLNLYCAPDSYLESMLLTRPSKNVFRQHRSEAEVLTSDKDASREIREISPLKTNGARLGPLGGPNQ